MMSYPCGIPECIFCAIHCPYCGQWPIVLDIEARRMCCPTCGQADDLIPPEMIAMRHRQVPAISGRSIAAWKASARQLHAGFHHRWRSTMNYLDPAASAALSYADDLMVTTGCSEDAAISLAQQAKLELQQRIDADPSLPQLGAGDEAYPDDWY